MTAMDFDSDKHGCYNEALQPPGHRVSLQPNAHDPRVVAHTGADAGEHKHGDPCGSCREGEMREVRHALREIMLHLGIYHGQKDADRQKRMEDVGGVNEAGEMGAEVSEVHGLSVTTEVPRPSKGASAESVGRKHGRIARVRSEGVDSTKTKRTLSKIRKNESFGRMGAEETEHEALRRQSMGADKTEHEARPVPSILPFDLSKQACEWRWDAKCASRMHVVGSCLGLDVCACLGYSVDASISRH